VAKQTLTLDRLREVIALEPGQPFRRPETLINEVHRLISCCINLTVLDEENQVAQTARHTVRQFLLEAPTDVRLRSFRINLLGADHEVGEICVTYLNFNNFKRQLAQSSSPHKRA